MYKVRRRYRRACAAAWCGHVRADSGKRTASHPPPARLRALPQGTQFTCFTIALLVQKVQILTAISSARPNSGSRELPLAAAAGSFSASNSTCRRRPTCLATASSTLWCMARACLQARSCCPGRLSCAHLRRSWRYEVYLLYYYKRANTDT